MPESRCTAQICPQPRGLYNLRGWCSEREKEKLGLLGIEPGIHTQCSTNWYPNYTIPSGRAELANLISAESFQHRGLESVYVTPAPPSGIRERTLARPTLPSGVQWLHCAQPGLRCAGGRRSPFCNLHMLYDIRTTGGVCACSQQPHTSHERWNRGFSCVAAASGVLAATSASLKERCLLVVAILVLHLEKLH